MQGFKLFYHEESQPESAPVQLSASVNKHIIEGLGEFCVRLPCATLSLCMQYFPSLLSLISVVKKFHFWVFEIQNFHL